MTNRQKALTFVLALLAASALFCILTARAAFAGNNNGPDFGGEVTCTDESGTAFDVETTCSEYVQLGTSFAQAICNPVVVGVCSPYCENVCSATAASSASCHQAEIACGNAEQVCAQGIETTLAVAQICGDAASSCDQSVTVNQERCPDVFVQANVLRCKSPRFRKDGTLKGCRAATVVIDHVN